MADADALTPRVFIARHGETVWAKSGRHTGITDIPLTPHGIHQVSATAAQLVGLGRLLDPTRLTHIFVSPRQRAQQTFRWLLGSNLDSINTEKITLTEEIAEWSYGDYEGLKVHEIKALRKERGLDKERAWSVWRDGCEGGESPEQVTERLDKLVAQIKDKQRACMKGEEAADILLVAHGLILRAFAKRWLGYPLDFPMNMILAPGAVGILSYKNNNIGEPAFHIGMALPLADTSAVKESG